MITRFTTVLQFLFVSVQSGVAGNATNHGKAEEVSPTLAVLEGDAVAPTPGWMQKSRMNIQKGLEGTYLNILLCQTSSKETAGIFSLKTQLVHICIF